MVVLTSNIQVLTHSIMVPTDLGGRRVEEVRLAIRRRPAERAPAHRLAHIVLRPSLRKDVVSDYTGVDRRLFRLHGRKQTTVQAL